MTPDRSPNRVRPRLSLLCLALVQAAALPAFAQTPHSQATALAIPAQSPSASVSRADIAFTPGQRLSAALLEATLPPALTNVYEPATFLFSPGETGMQQAFQKALLADLQKAYGSNHPLHQFIRRQGVSGRVVLPVPFAEQMAVTPKADPVLQAGQKISVYARPSSIMVINGRGALCRMPYAAGRESADYIAACIPGPSSRDAQIYVVQPDGRVQSFAVGTWRRSQQALPMPGAWIYVDDAPGLGKRLPDDFAQRFTRFLAWQGVEMASSGIDDLRRSGAVSLPALPMASQQSLPGSPGVYESRDLPVTSNDLGMSGLMQLPSARMRPEGNFTYTQTRVLPYDRYNVIFQPFEWLQAGFRYVDPNSRNSVQVSLDKNIDLKARLWQETAWRPEVAVGIQDLGGTGLFGGEYVVGNKRYGDFDFTLGLGWGYLGRRGSLSNPAGIFIDQFKTRPKAFEAGDQGGTFSLNTFFRGRMEPFAGVQYHTPIDRLILKMELDPNDYQSELGGRRFDVKSPVNVGAVWRYNRFVDLMAGIERGNQLQLGIAVNVDLLAPQLPKVRDAAFPPVARKEMRPLSEPQPATDWQRVADRIAAQTEWRVGQIETQGSSLVVRVDEHSGYYYGPKIERAAAVLNEEADPQIEDFTLVYNTRGIGVNAQRIDRSAFVREQTELVPPGEARTVVTSVDPATVPSADAVDFRQSLPLYSATLSPYYNQTLGGVQGLLFFQAGLNADLRLNITEKTWINSALRLRMLDNYENYEESPSPSTLPRTRTFLKEFNTTSRFNIPVLQANHMERVSENGYAMVYGGMLEYAFGGVGAEYLYQPHQGRVAVGVDANSVRLRDFDQKFDFRDYSVNTGHVTVYWDTGVQDLLVVGKAGQYIGGDRGVTLSVQRVFGNGVTMGAFATKTNVSAKDFGEGSFDKGIFVQVPFDYLLPKSTAGVVNFAWSPLTRDGGVILQRSQSLYNLNAVRNRRALYVEPVRQ